MQKYPILRRFASGSVFDADTGKDLREYFIPDFSNWKEHDSLESAFARLLQDLTAKTELDDG